MAADLASSGDAIQTLAGSANASGEILQNWSSVEELVANTFWGLAASDSLLLGRGQTKRKRPRPEGSGGQCPFWTTNYSPKLTHHHHQATEAGGNHYYSLQHPLKSSRLLQTKTEAGGNKHKGGGRDWILLSRMGRRARNEMGWFQPLQVREWTTASGRCHSGHWPMQCGKEGLAPSVLLITKSHTHNTHCP